LRVLFILQADFIDEFRIGAELLPQTDGPRLRIRLGIIHRYFDFEMSKIRPPDLLTEFGGVGNDAAIPVDPQAIAKSDAIDDEPCARPRGRGVP